MVHDFEQQEQHMNTDLQQHNILPNIELMDSTESDMDTVVYYIDHEYEYMDAARMQNQIFDLVRG
jgi:hypothetical protein